MTAIKVAKLGFRTNTLKLSTEKAPKMSGNSLNRFPNFALLFRAIYIYNLTYYYPYLNVYQAFKTKFSRITKYTSHI